MVASKAITLDRNVSSWQDRVLQDYLQWMQTRDAKSGRQSPTYKGEQCCSREPKPTVPSDSAIQQPMRDDALRHSRKNRIYRSKEETDESNSNCVLDEGGDKPNGELQAYGASDDQSTSIFFNYYAHSRHRKKDIDVDDAALSNLRNFSGRMQSEYQNGSPNE